MAKVANSGSNTDSIKYAVMLFVFALLFVNVLVIGFIFHAVNVNSEYKTRFEFDNLKFNVAVYDAVTNYLYHCDIRPDLSETNKFNSSKSLLPSVKIVEGCTWLTPRNYYRCVLEGVEYGVNDFTPYGLIFQIGDGRIYCKEGEDIVILRLRPSVPESTRTPSGGLVEMDRTSVKGPYLHNSEKEDAN